MTIDMETKAIYTVSFINTPELNLEFTKMLRTYKRNIWIIAIVCCLIYFNVALDIFNWVLCGDLYLSDWSKPIFNFILGLMFASYPMLVKWRIIRRFKKDPNNDKPTDLNLYQDHMEVIEPAMKSTIEYSSFTKMKITKTGVFLFMNELSAIGIPRAVLNDEIIGWLQQKIQVK